jgi:pilus assembly protein CpaF
MSLLRRIERGQEVDSGASQSKLAVLRVRRRPVAAKRDAYTSLKMRVRDRLNLEIDPSMDSSNRDEARGYIEELYDAILSEEGIVLSRAERQRLFELVVADILGFGPLEPLLKDPSITEIMVNGPKDIYVERGGKLQRVDNITFEDDKHVMRLIDRILAPLGRHVDESSPTVDARLSDGSRVSVVIPPISLVGPTLTIRKFSETPRTIEDLIYFGSITPEVVEFLRVCAIARLNIIISGGVSSGKTTLLNIISGFIPSDQRLISIENVAELQLQQEHVVTLESRPPNIEGHGEVSPHDLVSNSLHMRPDRIVLGKLCQGMYEALVMATNLCDGFLSTIDADSPRDAIEQLERFAADDFPNLPLSLIREQIADSVDLVVQQSRMSDGSRKVVNVTEVCGVEGQKVSLKDIFAFERAGGEHSRVLGCLRPTGYRPICLEQVEAHGVSLSPAVFGQS